MNKYYTSLQTPVEDLPEVWTDDRTPAASRDETQSDDALFVLKERYLVQQFIARGGMAMVYRGLDLQSRRTVALKILHQTNHTPSAYAGYFLQEARMTSLLHHPHIVHIYDQGQHHDLSFLVLEWIEGRNLCQELQTQPVFSVKRALTIAYAVALALGAAHDCHIVHRDVKPLNIMLGHLGAMKLIDFGIAKSYQKEDEREDADTDFVLGTPQYLSPEQAQSFPLSPATDVYALGVVLYEMLLGRRPFLSEIPEVLAAQHILMPPPAPSQLKPLIAPALEALLLRCLEKEPEKRFQHGRELAQALLVQLEDATGDECALSPLSLQSEEKETPGCDGDESPIIALISSEAAPGTSHHSALPIEAFLCGFIVLIALMSIYLALHLL